MIDTLPLTEQVSPARHTPILTAEDLRICHVTSADVNA